MIKRLIRWIKLIFVHSDGDFKICSLNQYLDLVSKYTDSAILKEERKGLSYTGGECTVAMGDEGIVKFSIEMYFVNKESKRFVKKAYRKLDIQSFDEETQHYIKEANRSFEIKRPVEDGQ